MGCDIHMFVERRKPGLDTWELVEAPLDGEDSDGNGGPPYRISEEALGEGEGLREWFHDRNYELFARLAGVRGCREPLVEPRGIPKDCSPEMWRQWEEHGEHTPSWYTLKELQDDFWVRLAPWAENFKAFMRELEEYGSPEDIRIVFYFDS